MSNSIRSPKQRLIYQIYTSTNNRNYTQPKTNTKMHLKLPNCSPSPKIIDQKSLNSKKRSNISTRRNQRSQQQSPVVRQYHRNRDSSESFMKELDLSGNEDLKEINKSLLLTSQEINKKMQFSIESYLNNTLKKKRQQPCQLNNFIDFDLTQDYFAFNSFEFAKSRRETPVLPSRRLSKK